MSVLHDIRVRSRVILVFSPCRFWVALLPFLGIALSNSPPYNLGKKYEAARGGLTMENELKTIIAELLAAVTDVDLLDLIYKLLLAEC